MPPPVTTSRRRAMRPRWSIYALATLLACCVAGILAIRRSANVPGGQAVGTRTLDGDEAKNEVPNFSPSSPQSSQDGTGSRDSASSPSDRPGLQGETDSHANPEAAPGRGQALNAAEEVAAGEPPREFATPTEQVIAMAMAAGPDGGPPLPYLSEAVLRRDLAIAITNPVVIYDDDEATVALKENIANAKEQMRKIVEAGGSLTNALREYEQFNNQGAALRRKVLSQYRAILHTNGVEKASAFLETANAILGEQGFDPVVPRSRRPRPSTSTKEAQ